MCDLTKGGLEYGTGCIHGRLSDATDDLDEMLVAFGAFTTLFGHLIRAAAGGDNDCPLGLQLEALPVDGDRVGVEFVGNLGNRKLPVVLEYPQDRLL